MKELSLIWIFFQLTFMWQQNFDTVPLEKNINIVRNVSKIMFLELPVRVGNLELITKNQDKWVFGMQKQVLIQFK